MDNKAEWGTPRQFSQVGARAVHGQDIEGAPAVFFSIERQYGIGPRAFAPVALRGILPGIACVMLETWDSFGVARSWHLAMLFPRAERPI